MVEATTDKSEKGVKLICKEIYYVEDIMVAKRFRLELTLASEMVDSDKLRLLKQTLDREGGECPVYVRLRADGYETLILTDMNIRPEVQTLQRLSDILGKDSVRLLPVNNP